MPSLVHSSSPRPFFILRKLTTLGCDGDNDYRIQGEGIAPNHAVVKLDAGRFILISQSRAFPIYVNGKKTKKHVLEHGDRVSLGSEEIVFNLWDEAGQTAELPVANHRDELSAYARLASFSYRLAESHDIDTLLEALIDEVIDLTSASKGFLLLNGSNGLSVRTARNVNRETIQRETVEFSDSIVARVLESAEPLIVSDALNDTVFCQSRSVMQLRLCSVMCAPLLFSGNLLGVIYVGNDNVVSLFERRSLDILSVFCSQAALLLAQAIHRSELTEDNARLRLELEGRRYGQLVGDSESMRNVFRRIEKTASTNVNILIRGETGTGKELIAREIHRRSKRADGPFVAINCGALPSNLIESAIFGHKRGAFTGAIADKVGSFQAANGGTLFLDEIGEMPGALQVKLLRAIQERSVTRLGSHVSEAVDIRLLAATHVDLETAIASGRFREDLYYRINVVTIELPPLKARGDDVVLLARHFLANLASEYERPINGFHKNALTLIQRHGWPGNIRELQNRLRKAVLLAEGRRITAEDLDLSDDTIMEKVMPLSEAKEDFQCRYIDRVLAINAGNRTKTARDLGVDPRTIFRHLEKKRGDDC